MEVTLDLLDYFGACPEDVATFDKHWPGGCTLTQDNCDMALSLGLDVEWFARRLLEYAGFGGPDLWRDADTAYDEAYKMVYPIMGAPSARKAACKAAAIAVLNHLFHNIEYVESVVNGPLGVPVRSNNNES